MEEFGDFSCAEFGGFADHTSTPSISASETCTLFQPIPVHSYKSIISHSFDFDQNNTSSPSTDILDSQTSGQDKKFVLESLLEQGFSQNQMAKLSTLQVYQAYYTHLSLADEGMSGIQNLSIPSLTSLSFFPEKTNSFELELCVADDNTPKDEPILLDSTNYLLDLSLPIKVESKSDEPDKVLRLDEELLSLHFGNGDTIDEQILKPSSPTNSLDTSVEIEAESDCEQLKISQETEDILQNLPDLSYLASKVLVFPIDK